MSIWSSCVPCDFPGCRNPRFKQNLCNPHERQKRLGQTLRPLRKMGPDPKARAREDADRWIEEVRARKVAK